MSGRIVPVAYVTKWAATAGIHIVRNAKMLPSGSLLSPWAHVRPLDWTEDKAEAEARYRAKIDAARQSAERKVKKLEALYRADPKYTEG